VVKSWYPDANISCVDGLWLVRLLTDLTTRFHEETGAPHWWSNVLASSKAQRFLDEVTDSSRRRYHACQGFILSAAIPEETGSLCGVKIEEISFPGSLGRIHFQILSKQEARIQTNNVQQFSLSSRAFSDIRRINIDGKFFPISPDEDQIRIFGKRGNSWKVSHFCMASISGSLTSDKESNQLAPPRPSGPIHRILSTENPLVIIIPRNSDLALSLALRLAHNLATYLKIDTQILYDNKIVSYIQKGTLGCSNIVVIGGYDNDFGQYILSGNPSPVRFTRDGWRLSSRIYESQGLGKCLIGKYRRISLFE
jgi:hypothetical protein